MNKKNNWSLQTKITFRFFFTYFLLFIAFYGNGAFPFYQIIQNLIDKILYQVIPWVGNNILNISYTIETGPNGSGDTTYNYVLIFSILVIAILTTIIWTLIDTKPKNYKKLYYWLTLIVRGYVSLMLINYGMVKVIQLQFSEPTMFRLTQNYGDSSPMGLAWTFLGFSKGYNIFMGVAEILAVLLLFRRTLTLGAIITLMTIINVMAINFFFDVPVKILSTHLVMMTLFLLAYNFEELLQFFFTKKPVSLPLIEKPSFNKNTNRLFLIIKILLLFYVLPYSFYQTLKSKEMYYGSDSESYLKGFYEVQKFKINDSIKRNTTYNLKRWKYLMIDSKEYALIKNDDDKNQWFKMKTDSLKKEIILQNYRDTLQVFNLNYKEKDSVFYLKGTIKKDSIFIKFKRTRDYKKKFLLTNRGFHWINEYPFNR